MKKRMTLLIALVFVFSMVLAACGGSSTASSPVKNTAVATMTEGSIPVEVKVEVSTGLSVVFYVDGFSLFQGSNLTF